MNKKCIGTAGLAPSLTLVCMKGSVQTELWQSLAIGRFWQWFLKTLDSHKELHRAAKQLVAKRGGCRKLTGTTEGFPLRQLSSFTAGKANGRSSGKVGLEKGS